MDATCPFCARTGPALADSELATAFDDAFPVSRGHVLVIPRRHVATYFQCSEHEKRALMQLVEHVREILLQQHNPDGFNIGFNDGAASGQTIGHAHIHVIPRYWGDVADPTGGVRHAVIGRGYYPAALHCTS